MTDATTATTPNPKYRVLQKSIEAFANRTFRSTQKTVIYLEGETGELYRCEGNNSMPSDAYHGMDTSVLTLHPGHVVTESLVRALNEMLPDIQALLDAYEGSEWNGNNYKGTWDRDTLEWFDQKEKPQIAYHQEPSDWFETCVDDLIEGLVEGLSVEEVIDGQSLEDSSGVVDRNLAIKWLSDFYEEWRADQD